MNHTDIVFLDDCNKKDVEDCTFECSESDREKIYSLIKERISKNGTKYEVIGFRYNRKELKSSCKGND